MDQVRCFFASVGVAIDAATSPRLAAELCRGPVTHLGRRRVVVLDWILQPSPLRGLTSSSPSSSSSS